MAAPLAALQAACFPLRELADRCRRSIVTLPTAEPSPPSSERAGLGANKEQGASAFGPADAADVTDAGVADADDVADVAEAACVAGASEDADANDHFDNDVDDRPAYGIAHWAKPGLDAVCRALDEALADTGDAQDPHIGSSNNLSLIHI